MLQGLSFLRHGLFLVHYNMYMWSSENDTCQSRTSGKLSLVYEERVNVTECVFDAFNSQKTFCICFWLS